MASSTAQSDTAKSDGGRSAPDWIKEVDAALKREETWRDRAKKVVQRYRDERDTERGSTTTSASRVNILWSNTEVLHPALYGKTAKPDVRRRFPDAGPRNKNDVARVAAETIERALDFCIDAYDVDTPVQRAVYDVLLPGRGVAWVVYEPEIEGDSAEAESPATGEDQDTDPAAAGGTQAGQGEYGGDAASLLASPEPGPRIVEQRLTLEHVYWEDFCHGLSRDWKRVPWVARRHAKRKGEFEKMFPEAVALKGVDQGDYELKDASGKSYPAEGDSEKFVEIWEIWNKPTLERIYVAKGYKDALQTDEDPYRLQHFFPCAEPMYSVTTTDRMIPEPEFLQYQDQAAELDVISTRIMRLTEMLKWNGVYDATFPDNAALADMSSANDGEFLPHKGFGQLSDRGGFEAAFGMRPIERIEPVIASLDQRRSALVQIIYEVTGISDIIRGSTDPRETKGAQQLKAQFGSMRLQKRQKDVQRFIRDSYRIMAEIIAEHFTAEQLEKMTSMDLPTPEEKTAAQAKIAMSTQPPSQGQPQGAASPQQAPQPLASGGPPLPFAGGAMSMQQGMAA